MSELVKCNGCSGTIATGRATDWLQLERFGIGLSYFGRDEGPWHFHNMECLALWSNERAKAKLG